ncbi:MAG: DUF4276 family protein [Acidobacteria bacterium]|nr:DUF4276 family protein [Acidobacteriota bacterium]
MSPLIKIGIFAEGPTDNRFLPPVVKRTFEEVAWTCRQQIDILEPEVIDDLHVPHTFAEKVLAAARQAQQRGVTVLCVHTDADAENDHRAFQSKIQPAFERIHQSTEEACKLPVAIVPVQMTEAWMLADTELFKKELNTTKTDFELGIHKPPESIADPKDVIAQAIRIATDHVGRRQRRYQVHISDLYQPVGQRISLEKLSQLSSFQKFRDAIREVFQQLNYMW